MKTSPAKRGKGAKTFRRDTNEQEAVVKCKTDENFLYIVKRDDRFDIEHQCPGLLPNVINCVEFDSYRGNGLDEYEIQSLCREVAYQTAEVIARLL